MPGDIVLTAAEVRDALAEPLSVIIEAIRTTLEQSPPELSSDIIDNGIVLTGGGALLRGLEKLVAQETGMPVRTADSPLDCVAEGAGRRLERMTSRRKRQR